MVTAAYHYFEQQGHGHLAVISSIAGTKGLGSAPAYSATKRFQNTYIEALDQLAHINRLPIVFTERRQISSADERFRSRRPHHQCTQQKETHRHHRPALSSAGVLLEAYSQMVMGQVARQELKSEKPITGNHFHFTL